MSGFTVGVIHEQVECRVQCRVESRVQCRVEFKNYRFGFISGFSRRKNSSRVVYEIMRSAMSEHIYVEILDYIAVLCLSA